jgi:hypothetical protein
MLGLLFNVTFRTIKPMTTHLPAHPNPADLPLSCPEAIDLVPLTTAASGTLEPLSDLDLDTVSGGRHHHHGHHGHGGHHGGGHHGSGHGHSHADFHSHKMSMSGQTVTAKDGSSVTSFTVSVEDISSHSDQVIG